MLQNDLGEELVVTTAHAEDSTPAVHVEPISTNDPKNRYSNSENNDKKITMDPGNAVFKKLEEVGVICIYLIFGYMIFVSSYCF